MRHQIRTAESRGAFRDLPLSGKPLPDSALRPDRDWLSEWVQREKIDTSVLLPLSILLAREVEQLPQRLAAEHSEQRVRQLVGDLDDRIRAAYRQVLTGPPMRTPPLDIEARVDRWRASRPVGPASVPIEPAGPSTTETLITSRPRRSRRTPATAIAALVVLVLVATVVAGRRGRRPVVEPGGCEMQA